MSETKLQGGAWHHVAASVRSMDRALAFFRDLLGFELLWEFDHVQSPVVDAIVGLENVDVHLAMLSGYGARLELFEYHHPRGRDEASRRQCDFGLTHFCLFVDDPRAEYQRLKAQGAEFVSPPQNHRPDGWVTYLKGPDGIVVELLNPGPTAE
jgi:catechol 2,3-dioxygenase-like lactoylglutathione lyase family enzyme